MSWHMFHLNLFFFNTYLQKIFNYLQSFSQQFSGQCYIFKCAIINLFLELNWGLFWWKSTLYRTQKYIKKLFCNLLHLRQCIPWTIWLRLPNLAQDLSEFKQTNAFLFCSLINTSSFLFSVKWMNSINPLTNNISHHIETSQLICNENQFTGFCKSSGEI